MSLPLILEPEQLQGHLDDPSVRVVDVCRYDVFLQQHIPGSVHVEYPHIVRHAPPVMGLLPDKEMLARVLSHLGITPETHIVAYDDEGGGKASRFLWTLDCIGHTSYSLLNGGLHAWANEGYPRDTHVTESNPTTYEVQYKQGPSCDLQYVKSHLADPNVRIVDCRSAGEFHGSVVRAARGGHIPGAVNFDWVNAMDQQRNLRIRTSNELEPMFAKLGITPEREIILYCQTHHRSAHTYIVLKSLGFQLLRGYPGSWSEWGNKAELPVEAG